MEPFVVSQPVLPAIEGSKAEGPVLSLSKGRTMNGMSPLVLRQAQDERTIIVPMAKKEWGRPLN